MYKALFVMLLVMVASFVVLAQSAAAPATQPAAGDYALLPYWPVGFKLPRETVESWKEAKPEQQLKSPEADVLVWTPPEAKRIRAVLMFPNNTDLVRIGEYKAIREVATRQEIGIVYLQQLGGKVLERSDPPTVADQTMATILDLCATKTGIAEFRHAPWITLGKSSRGRFPFRTTWWFPDRVIASLNHHGETPNWPMEKWSKAGKEESVMHLSVQGLSEWDGTWYRAVRPSLLNYNTQTNWLCHQMVIYGVDHGYYPDYYLYPNFGKPMEKSHRLIRCTDVWDYEAKFIDKAMELRVPKDSYPTDKPTTLLNVKRESGYLIHPRAPEELLGSKWFALRQDAQGAYKQIPWPDEVTPVFDTVQGTINLADLIKPASAVPAEQRGGYMWVADKELALAWLKLHSLYYQPDRVLK
ncbi:MAG: hypothetical protein WCJ97_05415 [Phycisphaerae bacterium]